jgi:hypothetical protein
MFVRYFVDLPIRYELVEQGLTSSPEDWLPVLAEDADAEGERLLAEVGFSGPGVRVDRRVAISLLPPLRFPSRLILPLTWKPARAEGLFPSLEADIEVAPVGPARTQLSISARYTPPMGLVGRAVDRTLLHRVAEATVRDFIERVAERIRESVSSAA